MAKLYKMELYVCDIEESLTLEEIKTLYDISKDATPESNKTRMEAINGLVSAYKVLKKL